jgi:hypothetical protein
LIFASNDCGTGEPDFRDLAVAPCVLSKRPAFGFTAAVTIALGFGASTPIFSVTNAVLLGHRLTDHPAVLLFGREFSHKIEMPSTQSLPFRP